MKRVLFCLALFVGILLSKKLYAPIYAACSGSCACEYYGCHCDNNTCGPHCDVTSDTLLTSTCNTLSGCEPGAKRCCNLYDGTWGIQTCSSSRTWGSCSACTYGDCSGGSCPSCTPDCSCADSTCIGETCDDGCGWTCDGEKTCPTPTPTCGTVNATCCGTSSDPNTIRCPQAGICSGGKCIKECPYLTKSNIYCEPISSKRIICENYRVTVINSCGFGCAPDGLNCNEIQYCENWCTSRCPPAATPPPTYPTGYSSMEIKCWTSRTCREDVAIEPDCRIPVYFDSTAECTVTNLYTCNSCHPNTTVCHADTLTPPCHDRTFSDGPRPYEWWDNCGGISCLADSCTPVNTTAPGVPTPTTCAPNCSCAANTCVGKQCFDPICNAKCNGSKDCSVTLTATAKYFASVPANCSDITNPAQGSYLYPVTFTMSGGPSTLISQTLSSPNPNVSWTNVQVGTYNILSVTPASPDYQHVTTCWTKSNGNSGQASSITFDPITEIGVTGNFFVAFGPPGPWHQTREGDVYSGGQLQTYIPSTVPAANRLYSLLGAGGTAGVISAGSLSVVPTPAWRVTNQTNPAQNFYASYRRKAATTTRTPLPAGTVSSFPASSTVYTTTGDLTFGNGSTLTVPDGVSVVYLVDGNVTITQPLTLANPNTSFLAIIASGTISVASTITGSSANPGLDGVFLAGTFRDLEQTPPASPHTPLFVRGLVAANNVQLNRNNADRSVPAETFSYNPALPFTMPEWMKDLYYEWREVAP